MKVSQASDNLKRENGGEEEDDDDTIIGANDLSEDSDSAASGGIVGRFVGEGGETITVVERDPAWMAELRKVRYASPAESFLSPSKLTVRNLTHMRFPDLVM